MALEPLVTQQPSNDGDAGALGQSTFLDRKRAELQQESEPTPGRPEDPAGKSAEDGYPDDESLYQQPEGDTEEEVQDDEEAAGDDEADDEEGALEGESTDDEDDESAEEGELSYEELKGKNLDLQRELSRVTENRKAIEKELSDGIAANVTSRHQLEDLNEQALTRANFFLNQAEAQVNQFETLNWSQIDPEKLPALQQQHQQAVAYRNQLKQMFDDASVQAEEGRKAIKQREAEVSRAVLMRRIPDWGKEAYETLREHAVSNLSFSPEEFGDITDWRLLMLMQSDLEKQQAIKTVRNVKRKSKAKAPRNRNGRPAERNAQGRFRSATDKAFSNPGDKRSFREMKEAGLKAERKRR